MPVRSTSPNSCSTEMLCGNSSEKVPYYREKGPGVQGKRWPKYRYWFSCLKVKGEFSTFKNLVHSDTWCCDIVDHLQGSFGPFGPKSEKSLEKGSRASWLRGAEKVRKKSKTGLKT